MPSRRDHSLNPSQSGVSTDDLSHEMPSVTPTDSSPYHPSSAFRRILNRDGNDTDGARTTASTAPVSRAKIVRVPALLHVIASAFVVGVVSGFLELLIVVAQVRGLHVVDWSTLMITRHIAGMVPVVAPLLIVSLTIVLVIPALVWASRRGRRHQAGDMLSWTWEWAGTVLGTLLLLGPLLSIRGFHVAAPLAVSVGVGFRIRRWMIRPTAGWRRGSYRAAGIAAVVLTINLFWQWKAYAATRDLIGPRPAAHARNLLWIVVDTLRADRMSLYGYQRSTTPELDSRARQGITFDMARSAAPWTLPSHLTMFTGLWPAEHGASVNRAYSGTSPTLAEHLKAHGYVTGGVVANVRMCNAAYGVGRGFDTYVDYPWNEEISLGAALNNSAAPEPR